MKPVHRLMVIAFLIMGFCLGLYVLALEVK